MFSDLLGAGLGHAFSQMESNPGIQESLGGIGKLIKGV